jgi:hypothetical protein
LKQTLTNTFCALLVLTSYLWGECVSCQQFMAQTPDCCHHDKCDRTSHDSSKESSKFSQVCEQMPWSQAETQDSSAQLAQDSASVPVAILAITTLLDSNQTRGQLYRASDPLATSPPDLSILHASLLI